MALSPITALIARSHALGIAAHGPGSAPNESDSREDEPPSTTSEARGTEHPRSSAYPWNLAAASPVRDHVVPLPPSRRERTRSSAGADSNQPVARRRYDTWAELLERVLGTRVLPCPRCGAARHMIATITDPAIVRWILLHLKLPPDPLPIAPAREPALFW